MKKFTIIFFALLLLGGCSGASFKTISADKADEMIQNGKIQVIDVRSTVEFADGHIPNAKLIPIEDLESMKLKLSKKKAYLMVCRSGSRSARASEFLAKKGYTKIYNLKGGMNNWKGEVEK